MDFVADLDGRTDEVARLFYLTFLTFLTFTASERADEGALIERLAKRLMTETSPEDGRVLVAWDGGAAVGAIIFSRLK